VHVAEVTLAAPVTAGVAVLLLARARRSPEVDTTLRPLRTFWVLLLGTTGLVVLGAFAIHSPGAPALPPAVVAVGGATGACLLWLAALLVRVAAARSAMLPELPVGYLALGLGAADRAFGAVVGDPTVASWSVAAGRAVSLVGCILLLVAALRTFRGAQLTALARTRNLRLERDNVVRGLDAQRALLAQDRHDLRSLVAGIQDATTTLTAYRDHLDPDDRQQLETALVAEIQRLRRAVGGEQPVSTFRLATALRPVITLERIRGTAVEADLPDVEVEGSAEAAAAVVQNILANTRRHAPGAVASVHVRVDPDHVRLVVTDDGPGLPDEVRRWAGALFDEPHREPVEAPHRGEGHGLGFAICARLAHDHGMRLELLPAERAGFELSLPLARAVRVGQVA
jgi:signal transduction histidine kinase